MAPRETENNAYAKFWGDKQRALWYVIVFSGVVNCPGSFSYPWCFAGALRARELRYYLREFDKD